MTIEIVTAFLGWGAVINIAILMLTAVVLLTMRQPIVKLHSKLLGVEESRLPLAYFKYLANYKIAVIVLYITPYLALKIIG